MKTRIITAIVMAVVGVPILVFSETIEYSIAAGLLCLCCAWELLGVVGMRNKFFISIPSYLLSLCLPLFGHTFFFPEGMDQMKYMMLVTIILFGFLAYLNFVAVFSKGQISAKDVGVAYSKLIYIIASFVAIVMLRYMPNGEVIYFLVFIIPWMSDASAYFVGTFLGKHKLAPHISPKKTVEGAIGGIVFASAGAVGYGFLIGWLVPSLTPNYWALAIIGCALSVISQLGDLWASLIKREYGVKDYGTILPGHGGIFDRFDSVLAACVPLTVICYNLPPFV